MWFGIGKLFPGEKKICSENQLWRNLCALIGLFQDQTDCQTIPLLISANQNCF